jgi:hypothetical protein
MPSVRLQQEAQRFGLREKAFPVSGMSSPQTMQTRGFILEDSPPQLTALQAIIMFLYYKGLEPGGGARARPFQPSRKIELIEGGLRLNLETV